MKYCDVFCFLVFMQVFHTPEEWPPSKGCYDLSSPAGGALSLCGSCQQQTSGSAQGCCGSSPAGWPWTQTGHTEPWSLRTPSEGGCPWSGSWTGQSWTPGGQRLIFEFLDSVVLMADIAIAQRKQTDALPGIYAQLCRSLGQHSFGNC